MSLGALVRPVRVGRCCCIPPPRRLVAARPPLDHQDPVLRQVFFSPKFGRVEETVAVLTT